MTFGHLDFIFQLRDGNQDEIQAQLVQAQSHQAETQRQLEETRAALSKTQTENKQVAGHYQQYTAQLVSQLQALQEMVRYGDLYLMNF